MASEPALAQGRGGTPASQEPVRPTRAADVLFTALPALLLAVIATALCRAAAGVSLGLFFGGVAAATLLVPPLAAGERAPWRVVLVPGFIFLGVAVVWLTALGDLLHLNQWLACCAVLVAYAYALAAICTLLIAARCNRTIAASLVTALALLWLTWPVWLSAALRGPAGESLVAWLVPAHPLFAINGVLSHFDPWDRYPLAYRELTVLNQDVFYAMPATVRWTVMLHAAVTVAAYALCRLLWRRAPTL